MNPKTIGDVASISLRVLLGFWFTYSGGIKLFVSGLDQFTRDLANYRLLMPPYDAIGAYTVPWLEVVVGVCLMLGVWTRASLALLGLLVLSFAGFIAWAWAHQLDISCGCLGSSAPIHYWWKAVELTAYAGAIVWLWRRGEPRICPSAEQKLQNMA